MDLTSLITTLPNLAFAVVALWYLMQQNKDLREQLNNATESRLAQLEKVIAAMTATANSLAALTEKVNDKCGSNKA